MTAAPRPATKPDLKLETVALLAARYAVNLATFDATNPASRAEQAAARAIADVVWAERVGRLPHLHRHLAGA